MDSVLLNLLWAVFSVMRVVLTGVLNLVLVLAEEEECEKCPNMLTQRLTFHLYLTRRPHTDINSK